MSRNPTEEVVSLVRDLIRKLTNFQDDSEVFAHCEKYILSHFIRADSMLFLNRKEIDVAMSGFEEKFQFHGFKRQAEELRKCYVKFIPKELGKPQIDDRLNILKCLICLSESPTKYFLENPEFKSPIKEEEEVDWSAYLKEGVERWSPTYTSSSDDYWSDTSEEDHVDKGENDELLENSNKLENVEEIKEDSSVGHQELRKKIIGSIQSVWYTKSEVQEIPESRNIDARVSIHWNEYVEHATHGLLIQKSNIFTEYKVMREIIWQFWNPHTSPCFNFIGNSLLPKENVSISSVRPIAFEAFTKEFLPYIETLQFFREFHKSLLDNTEMFNAPGTYLSYSEGLQEIVRPFFKELVKLEDEIKQQKTIMTLLKLSSKLRDLYKNVSILKQIHDEVILDFNVNNPTVCAITLLSRLYNSLTNSITSKKELDIYLTLYISSLFRYFQIINWWLNNDNLIDTFDEFIIINGDSVESKTNLLKSKYSIRNLERNENSYEAICFYDGVDCSSNSEIENNDLYFAVREMEDVEDGILKIIKTEVTQIGKNIRHLHMLHKLHLLDTKSTSTLYSDFVEKLLSRISNYFKNDVSNKKELGECEQTETEGQMSFKFPAMCPDYVKYPTDMDKLENLVDTSDGFLMKAFESFFTEKIKENIVDEEQKSLYEKISSTTKGLFPIEQMLNEVFLQVLKDRYDHSGFIVRDLLFDEHHIEEHFELLKYLFLFKDDLISPWYRRLFQQMEKGSQFDSDIWLTSHLHDILMDIFPRLYQRCTVKASDMWNFYRDPLKACGLISIEYLVDWPISMIIRRDQIEMYKNLFQFILQIKWALYTLNRMGFDEIEPNIQISKQHKAVTILLRRLKVYRFWLINEFSKIQHYILGNLCTNALVKFKIDLENACNLDTLFSSHNDFIYEVHSSSMHFRDYNHNSYGFNYLLYLVTKLRLMWSNLKSVDDRELAKFEKSYKICHNGLEMVMNPDNVNVLNLV